MRLFAVPDVLGVSELVRYYRDGVLRPHQIVDLTYERIAAAEVTNPSIWICRVPYDELRARADELAALDPSELALYGVPFAVKDNIDVAGLPTTAACPAFGYTPRKHAGSVRRLLDAGAIMVGKTNLDQFATGLTGCRSPYGACESVFGGDLISGGSSSGSAVAVAAGLVPFALGTDTAGSGRVPAAMNGIVGLKPTRGLVGASGVVPACRSLDCVSVFTHGLADAEAALSVLAGPDPDDAWSRTAPSDVWSHPLAAEPATGTAFRLAIADASELDFEHDVPMASAYLSAQARATARATGVHRIPLGPLLEAGELLYGPWVAERLAGLAEFLAEHPDDVLPVTRAVIERGHTYSAADAFAAIHRLRELHSWSARLWEHADALLLPTAPATYTRAQITEQPHERNLVLGRYTQFANLLDMSAVAFPAGLTDDGRPVGLSLLGPAFAETRLLRIAHQLQEAA